MPNWKDMTPEQRAARVAAMKAGKARERAAPRIARPHEPILPADNSFDEPMVAVEDEFDPDTEALIKDGLITRDEVIQLRIDAKAKVATERKAAAKKTMLAHLVEQERRAAGLLSPESENQKWLDEIVHVQVMLPALKPAPGHGAPTAPYPIVLDGKTFHHGRNYAVTRAVALTLYDQMGRAARHHAQIAGESPAFYSMHRGIYSQGGEVGAFR